MGGSGGGGGSSIGHYVRQLADAEAATAEAAFKTELAEQLSEVLGARNERDAKLVNERLDDILGVLGSEVGEEIDTLFGGSVAKHTYVDGLSDIDTLLVINETSLADSAPKDILDYVASALKSGLSRIESVSTGTLAVTVQYKDGMELQLLPALRRGDRVLIPDSDGQAWSHINPRGFQKALTDRNKECNGQLVPLIKLVKCVNAKLPEHMQMTGYHIESTAVAAFRGYDGTRDLPTMLPHFFKRAAELVLSPIKDRSGQSVHVDEYLGRANSADRWRISSAMDRVLRKMDQAQRERLVSDYMDLFDL